MTREKQYGSSLLVSELAAKLVRANFIPRASTPPVEWQKFCVNGYAPSAQFVNQLHEATNQAVIYRTRMLFAAISHPNELEASSGSSLPVYRFAFRTGSYHLSLVAFVTMQPPLGALGNSPSYGRLKIFSDTAEAVTVKTTDFYYGASQDGVEFTSTRGWSFAKTVRLHVTGLSANTDYYACFYNEAGATIQTATVVEMQSMTDHLAGYLPTNINQDSEVFALYREKVATIQKNLWKNSGPTVLNWTRIDGTAPLATTSATATNIVDNSSTTISASTPGYTLDMRYKDRVSQTSGIPCIMKVYGSVTGATLDGNVYLKDSTGATVASITGQWNTIGGAAWKSTTFNLPATLAKYDLQFSRTTGGQTFSLHAVSIWEYET